MHKKAAARKAAAAHSTNAWKAVNEYANLTGQILFETDGQNVVNHFNRIREEMFNLLEPYRHPVGDSIIEYATFYSPSLEDIDFNMTGYQIPPFIDELKECEVAPNILKQIQDYVKKTEQDKIKLNDYERRLTSIESDLQDAQNAWDNAPKDERKTLICEILGFSTGKRSRSYNGVNIFHEYVSLIRKQGLSRKKAVEEIMNKYGFTSIERTKRNLQNYRLEIYQDVDKKAPNFAKDFRKIMKGVVPSYNKNDTDF
ncbi:hypothetical protein [Desulfocicer niacini]